MFDRSIPPVARVCAGELVTIETWDACYGRVRSITDFVAYRKEQEHTRRFGNPITGPVYVEGAKPGGTLMVEILNIILDETGFQMVGPERGVIRNEVAQERCYLVRVAQDRLLLGDRLELRAKPTVGTLGNAPVGEPTNHPGQLGGNLDVPQVCKGAKVYLPIQVEGAMFYLGDVHAAQGDGEIVGAPEIGAKVEVRFELLGQKQSCWPMIEDAGHWHFVACAGDQSEAVRVAVLEAAKFVASHYGMSLEDALVLLTMTVEIHCCRISGWGNLEPVICVSFPKAAVQGNSAITTGNPGTTDRAKMRGGNGEACR